MSPNRSTADAAPEVRRAEDGAVIIDLRVDSFDALFHPHDPDPFAERALAPMVDAYLREEIAEVPRRERVCVRIAMPRACLAREADIRAAFRHHFGRSVHVARRRLREHFAHGAVVLLIALVCAALLLGVAHVIANFTGSRILDTMARWLTVVMWVVLWRPTEILLHDWWPIRHDRVLAERLRDVEITCVESEPG
jgi:hypothetical protein